MNTESQQRTQCPTCGQIIPLNTELQRREQQVWTPEWLAQYSNASNFLDWICHAHNAALTAEREKLQLMTDNRNFLIGQRDTARNETAGLEQQLLSALDFKSFVHRRLDTAGVPTEFPDGVHTKEGCRIGDRLDWLVEKLLSALAAIEKLKPHAIAFVFVEHGNYHRCKVCGSEWLTPAPEKHETGCVFRELSLLHEHDAEVRKPLVDALEKIRDSGGSIHESNIKIATDALAKVKQ